MAKIKELFLKLFASIGVFFTALFSIFLIFNKNKQKPQTLNQPVHKPVEEVITEVQNEIEKTEASIILDNSSNANELRTDIDRITETTRTNIRNRISNIVQSTRSNTDT